MNRWNLASDVLTWAYQTILIMAAIKILSS